MNDDGDPEPNRTADSPTEDNETNLPVRSDGSGGANSLDQLIEAIQHPYRRRILLVLSEQATDVEDEFLVEDFATDDESLERFSMNLYHVHLPKLDERGFIEWDREVGTVRQGANFEEVVPLLQLIREYGVEFSNV